MKEPTNGELKIMLDNMLQNNANKHAEQSAVLNKIETGVIGVDEKLVNMSIRVSKHDWQFKAIWVGLGVMWALILAAGAVLAFMTPYCISLIRNEINTSSATAAQQVVSNLESQYNIKVTP